MCCYHTCLLPNIRHSYLGSDENCLTYVIHIWVLMSTTLKISSQNKGNYIFLFKVAAAFCQLY